MPEPVLFQSLTPEERIEFFVNCQQILANHHPDSPFAFTTANLSARKNYFKDFYNKYKGFSYTDNNVCILFNKIYVGDPRDPVVAVKSNLWKEPSERFNAYLIDFVAFDLIENCLNFCRAQYQEKIKYILFARHNDIKIYETQKLLNKLNNLPSFNL